jgi:iron complex outermembrane receptor protein
VIASRIPFLIVGLAAGLHLAIAQGSVAAAAAPAQQPAAGSRTDAAAVRVLTGTVADGQGARVPDAEITATCGTTLHRGRSRADGGFELRLPAAGCDIRIERSGFDPFVQRVDLAPERDTVLQAVLTVGTVQEAVVVRAPESAAPRRASTATKTDTPLIETPQSVTVITAAQIRDQASPNLQETVRYSPGVRSELYGIDNRGDWISLRGSEESTTLLDGMRLPLTGWWGVVRNEPYAYERVEILRGPSSIIAGANDPGGVVNLVSKRPLAEKAQEFGVRVGNYSRRELHLDTTGPIGESRSWLYRFVALGRDSGTQIRYADESRVLVAPSVTWRPGARGSLTMYGEYQRDRSKNTNAFLGLDGTLRPAPNGPIPTDVFIGEPSWDRYGGSRWRLGYAADVGLNGSWRLQHNLRHDRAEGLMKSMYAAWWSGFLDETGQPNADGRYLARLWYVNDDDSQITTSEVLLQGRRNTGRLTHTLVFGVDGMLHDASQVSGEGDATPLNVYAPAYGSFADPFRPGAPATDTKIERLGLLAQDQIKVVDRVNLRLGVRRDRVRNAIVDGEIAIDWATSVNVGAVYEVRPGLAPYASYSESFNPVSGTDAGGNIFKPKRGEQVEAGVKWESQVVPVQATGAWYALKERNRLTSDPGNVGYSVQIGEARIKGLELEAKGDVSSWSVLGSYSYTRARASAASWGGDLDPTQQMEAIPAHTSSIWAVHDFGRLRLPGFRLGGGVRHVGRIGDGTGAVFVPPVTLLDALASYDTRVWRFALNVNNLTDKSYLATCLARGDCWFGARRMVSLTASVKY